jgi:glycosyltransferase involved in cell wall biosynthesis
MTCNHIGSSSLPGITLCMVVKDEEAWIGRALSSAKPWVDEIVLVDTGSSDRTVEIARESGARVALHPWQDSFALHRNQSLDMASYDWVLVLDADELLDQDTAPLLRAAIADTAEEGFILPVYSQMGHGGWNLKYVARFLKRRPSLRYQGIIHEQPNLASQPSKLGVKIYHYGYNLEPRATEAKLAQRLPMLEARLANEPDSLAARVHLANCLLRTGREDNWQKALAHGREALHIAQRDNLSAELLPRVLWAVIVALRKLSEWDALDQMTTMALDAFPDWPDAVMAGIWVAMWQGDWPRAASQARRFLVLQDHFKHDPQGYPYSQNSFLGQERLALQYWLDASARQGSLIEAKEAADRLLAEPGGEQLFEQTMAGLNGQGFSQAADWLRAQYG